MSALGRRSHSLRCVLSLVSQSPKLNVPNVWVYIVYDVYVSACVHACKGLQIRTSKNLEKAFSQLSINLLQSGLWSHSQMSTCTFPIMLKVAISIEPQSEEPAWGACWSCLCSSWLRCLCSFSDSGDYCVPAWESSTSECRDLFQHLGCSRALAVPKFSERGFELPIQKPTSTSTRAATVTFIRFIRYL